VRAVRLPAAGASLRVEELPLPEPTGTAVRIAVSACGVCHSDLHLADGAMPGITYPLTLGHEVAGHIDAIGPAAGAALRDAGLAPGDPVLVYGGWGCGGCDECRTGEEQRCADWRAPGFQRDGGYADAMLVPHPHYLVPLGSLDPVRAAPLADAGVTPFRAVRRATPWLRHGARVAVIGFGGLGRFALQYLRRTDAGRIAVVEPRRATWDDARSLGADAVIADLHAPDLLAALGGRPQVLFDLVGSQETLDTARPLVAPDGLLMIVGEAGGTLRVGMEPPLETWASTTSWGSLADLREVVALARAGEIGWEVEAVPLADAARAHERLRAGDVRGRLVLVPGP